MSLARTMAGSLVVLCLVGLAPGQSLVPLADRVEQPLEPAGVSEHAVRLSGGLAYLFRDPDGTVAVQLVGGVELAMGEPEGCRLRSREAVVWMVPRSYRGRAYHELQVLLWGDAEVVEVGGTATAGPALFVGLASYGAVSLSVDDVASRSLADSVPYQHGNRLRQALKEQGLPSPMEHVSLRIFDASGLVERREPRVQARVSFRADELTISELDGQRVGTATGRVYLTRGRPGGGGYLEIQAESGVVFMAPAASGDGSAGRTPGGAAMPAAGTGDNRGPGNVQRWADEGELDALGLGGSTPEAIYLEGDVVLAQGPNLVRASRIYYDLKRDRALILDAVVRTSVGERNLPLYLRASEVRQWSAREFSARDALLTTSEFYTPHYHIAAKEVELVDRSVAEPTGELTSLSSGRFEVRHATLNFGGVPVLYWPYVYGDLDASETSIRSIRSGFSDEFGLELETDWDLFHLLGLQQPVGMDTTLSLDFFTHRGPASGVDSTYQQDTYEGLLRSYLIWDEGEDSLGREREDTSFNGARGRMLWRHRQYFEDDWQVSLELSYISDRNFLEEFFEPEFDLDKEQETLIHVKKQTDNWAVTGLLQWRLLDFYTQTEHLPEFGFWWIGEPIAPAGTWFSENRLGAVRLRGADQTFFEWWHYGAQPSTEMVLRADSRQEVEYPFDTGPVRWVPFLTARGTSWDDSCYGGGLTRGLVTYGLRSSMYFSRVFADVDSELFDIHGIRHVIKPDAAVWLAHTNYDSDQFEPISQGVETVDEIDGVSLGVRQRWQTKRGEGEAQRTVDLVTLDVEVSAFSDAHGNQTPIGYASPTRPEESIARNHVRSSCIWRVNDRTAVISEGNYDLNDREVDIFNLSLAVERPPRLAYLLGYRYIGESESNLLGFGANYQMTEKHTLALRELFDVDRGRTSEFTVGVIRRFPRWFAAVSFELDDAEDDFGVSMSVWPEGLPQAALGSRRFTGLGATTRMMPE